MNEIYVIAKNDIISVFNLMGFNTIRVDNQIELNKALNSINKNSMIITNSCFKNKVSKFKDFEHVLYLDDNKENMFEVNNINLE
jgi:vacuolar-type H+-ATPase subunit F/Vma7